ncbi:MAG: riboflavin synthase [Mariniblastus sp.]|nr:riboflavin synthase [Mariniblastus sp.]
MDWESIVSVLMLRVSLLFTGLVEETAIVSQIERSGESCDITLSAERVVDGAKLGDSVSVNGCCLTIVGMSENQLTFQAGTETLSKTNLGGFEIGSVVNLERALRAGDRLGGHYVSGHIDGIGRVAARNDEGEWAEFRFAVSRELTSQMASKGSIAVDGVSLTLVDVMDEEFSVALIPHTLQVTTLGRLQVGDTVNIETDILAKYVQQQLERAQPK